MADNWNPRASRLQRLSQTVKAQTPHDLQGRLAQAAPVPSQTIPEEIQEGSDVLFVGPDDPGLDAGYPFWFDTDDIVG